MTSLCRWVERRLGTSRRRLSAFLLPRIVAGVYSLKVEASRLLISHTLEERDRSRRVLNGVSRSVLKDLLRVDFHLSQE